MTTGGWISLTISLGFVWGLLIWCFGQVMKGKKIEVPPDSLGM